MTETTDPITEHFNTAFAAFKEASPLSRDDRRNKLISQIDRLTGSEEGLHFLYRHSLQLEASGIFENSAWADPGKLAPPLVRGTMMAGSPGLAMEILSELRLLATAEGQSGKSEYDREAARAFLEGALVHNLDFAFGEANEESRVKLSAAEAKKISLHFRFLVERMNLSGIKTKLADEIEMICAQRPVVTRGVRSIIATVRDQLDLGDGSAADLKLQSFVDAAFRPSDLSRTHPDYAAYKQALANAGPSDLQKEAAQLGKNLEATGLTNPYLAMALRHGITHAPDMVPLVLHLSPGGAMQWQRFSDYAGELALSCYSEKNTRGIYGFKRLLERDLLSRDAVRAGLTNLRLASINPEVKLRILKSVAGPQAEVTAKQYLLGALMGLLGQPLGIGQGNNATCQSARGISLWAQHAPAKLINMVITAATSNNLIMRFENTELESQKLGKGLVDKLDHKLDALSVVLVPLLDKIYSEMMRLASGRSEDPHKWVNPALYGHWIPAGFASAYSYLTRTIQDYDGFVRLFYAASHPTFNGGREMVYPNPTGIFITSSNGDMLGFHAVSLLRIDQDPRQPQGNYRAYFLNPNNEGRQNWGQGISPTVFGHGERHGESSLPLHEFTARIYAFHYNTLHMAERAEQVSQDAVNEVRALAESSWGKSYTWSNLKKPW